MRHRLHAAALLLAASAGLAPRFLPQPPASAAPRLFGEGVISTSDDEFGGSFTPNGDTIYFTKSAPHSYRYTMLESHRVHGQWSVPTVLPFSGRYTDSDPTVSPDGSKMFWTSDRPVNGAVKHDYDIWMVERTPTGAWSDAKRLPEPINSDASEYAASMTRDGTLYFSSAREGAIQVFESKFTSGAWTSPVNVTRQINHGDTTVAFDLDVMIDPDERFIMLGSFGRRESLGSYDVYVSWRDNGVWTPAVHLPAPFNTRARDYAPHLSPDGRTLLFSSERNFGLDPIDHPLTYRELTDRLRGTLNGSGNIYEVSMAAVEAFHPAATGASATSDDTCPDGPRAAFKWWIGSWNYSVPGYDPGSTTVSSTGNGCALHESFVDTRGQKAETNLAFDATGQQWTRIVTDPFKTYRSTGTFAADGSIAFYETASDRETYRPIDGDHVHVIGERSTDGGKTWKVLYDATLVRRP